VESTVEKPTDEEEASEPTVTKGVVVVTEEKRNHLVTPVDLLPNAKGWGWSWVRVDLTAVFL
jgi:hypothetical protein